MAPSKLTTVSFTTFSNIIDGEPRSSKTKYHGIDPCTKQPLWDVPVATPQDVDDAVIAATKAFAEWKKTTWEYRSERFIRYKEALDAGKQSLNCNTQALKQDLSEEPFYEIQISSQDIVTAIPVSLSQRQSREFLTNK